MVSEASSVPAHTTIYYSMVEYIVFLNDSLITKLYNFNPSISDHEAIIFDLKVNKPRPVSKMISYRSLGKLSYDKVLADIASSFMLDDTPTDITNATAHYNWELENIMDKHAPLKTKMIVEKTNSEWFTDEQGELKTTLRKLEHKYKSSQLQSTVTSMI